MTRPSLKSRFGEQIRAFVGYKNSLGFPYNESIRILGRFDDFCVERFPEKDCLDCELALAWLEKRDTGCSYFAENSGAPSQLPEKIPSGRK